MSSGPPNSRSRAMRSTVATATALLATALAAPASASTSTRVTFSLVATPSTVAYEAPFALKGHVTHANGRPVQIQRKVEAGWHTDAVKTVGPKDYLTVTRTGLAQGTYTFRLHLLQTRSAPSASSRAITVTVLAPPPPPLVSMTFPGSANENTPISFTYGAANVPSDGTLVLQRSMGTSNTFGTVLTLDVKATTATAPALPLGQYTLRIAALSSKGAVLASNGASIKVFGNVPMSTLYGSSGSSNTIVAGGHSFTYVDYEYNNDQVLHTASSVCRSIHVDLARRDDGYPADQKSVATVVQQTADPVSTLVATNSITSLDATLKLGQSWALSIHASNTTENYPQLYLNGYASCYAAQQLR